MKQFVEVGYKILHLEEKEVALLEYLNKNHLLKFDLKKIEVYGYEEKEEN